MSSWVTLLFAVCLLHLCETQGTSVTVFVQTGGDLHLNVDADVPEDYLLVDWKFNQTVKLVRFTPGRNPNVFPNFTGRIEFLVKEFSVKLKNLQKADSGAYTARVDTHEGDQQLVEYKVTVQDPVSPVKLSVVSVVSRSSASCNLTVNCSTQDSHISSTFTCVNPTCSQEGGEQAEVTTSGAFLQVYLLNSSIICNHSNQVNESKDFTMIEQVCLQPDERKPVPVLVIVICLTTLLVIGVLVILFLYRRKRGNYKRESIENTIYTVAAPAHKPLDQSPTDDASGLAPTSTYSFVGPHTGSLEPSETRDPAQPESLYAQVDKPGRSSNN